MAPFEEKRQHARTQKEIVLWCLHVLQSWSSAFLRTKTRIVLPPAENKGPRYISKYSCKNSRLTREPREKYVLALIPLFWISYFTAMIKPNPSVVGCCGSFIGIQQPSSQNDVLPQRSSSNHRRTLLNFTKHLRTPRNHGLPTSKMFCDNLPPSLPAMEPFQEKRQNARTQKEIVCGVCTCCNRGRLRLFVRNANRFATRRKNKARVTLPSIRAKIAA